MSHTLTATHVGVTRLAGHIGAEISEVDTGTPRSVVGVSRVPSHALLLAGPVAFCLTKSDSP